jgi:crotonobetainyl-CoA:carnitine CoA-transferase CaiB-like acyl-CoA transferase
MTVLEGIKVLDLGSFVYGPHAAVLLADMGAEVIKVEHPAGGDPSRALGAVRVLPMCSNFNYVFEEDNRNKKSIAVDLNQKKGQEIIHKLVSSLDVIITNFQANVLKRLRMDYDTISAINPKVIYAYGSGWGLKGPLKDAPAFDAAAFARSGMMATFGDPNSPLAVSIPGLGDHIGAITLAYGTMLALFHRERTGEGQMVHASLFGSLIEAGSINLAAALATGVDMPRIARTTNSNPLWTYYECKDKKYLQLSMLQTDRHWHDFCEAMGIQNLEKDPRFDSHQKRGDNTLTLMAILDTIFHTKTREEWIKLFEGRNIIWSPVQTYLDLTTDPQLIENENIVNFNHPIAGPTKIPGIPVQFSKTPGKIKSAAPQVGQHTEEILLEMGYSWDEIAEFKDKKVIL